MNFRNFDRYLDYFGKIPRIWAMVQTVGQRVDKNSTKADILDAYQQLVRQLDKVEVS